MAEQEDDRSLLGEAFSALAAGFSAVMADGQLAAAGRQGIEELGQALQAFPDSIQVASRDSFLSQEPYQPEMEPVQEMEMDRGR